MDALALLKHWRCRRAAAAFLSDTATIADTVSQIESVDNSSSGADDEGPFFDLEFEVPDDDNNEEGGGGRPQQQQQQQLDKKQHGDVNEEEEEFNFPVSTEVCRGDDETDISLSPSDDLFFKGRLVVPLSSTASSETKPLFLPISLLKSATRFRVFMSALKKPRTVEDTPAATEVATTERGQQRQKRQFFTVKFKVEDVPIMSLFARDGSGRGNGSRAKETEESEAGTAAVVLGEKRFSKEVVQKYLQKFRPLYTRVYNKYNAEQQTTTTTNASSVVEEERLPGEEVEGGGGGEEMLVVAATSPAATVVGRSQKLAHVASHLPAGLRVVCKNLVKSNNKSSSAVVAAVASSPTSVLGRRRDDSLLQQQDGIQSAIAHCKKSLNSPKELDSGVMVLMSPENDADKCKEDFI